VCGHTGRNEQAEAKAGGQHFNRWRLVAAPLGAGGSDASAAGDPARRVMHTGEGNKVLNYTLSDTRVLSPHPGRGEPVQDSPRQSTFDALTAEGSALFDQACAKTTSEQHKYRGFFL
jgi:hypothetical protein